MSGLSVVRLNVVGTATDFLLRLDGAESEKIDAPVAVEAIEARDWSERALCLPESAVEVVRIDMIESRSIRHVMISEASSTPMRAATYTDEQCPARTSSSSSYTLETHTPSFQRLHPCS